MSDYDQQLEDMISANKGKPDPQPRDYSGEIGLTQPVQKSWADRPRTVVGGPDKGASFRALAQRAGVDPKEVQARQNIAQTFAKPLNLSPASVADNTEGLSKALYGEELKPSNFWQKLVNTFTAQPDNQRIGDIGGRVALGMATEADQQELKQLKARQQPKDRILGDFGSTVMGAVYDFLIGAPNTIMRSVLGDPKDMPKSASEAAKATAIAFGSLVQNPLTPAKNLNTLVEGPLGRTLKNTTLQSIGSSYIAMTDAGVKPEVAKWTAISLGAVNDALMALPMLRGIAKGGEIAATVAAKTVGGSLLRGQLVKTALEQGAYAYGGQAINVIAKEIAMAASNLPTDQFWEMMKEIGIQGSGAFTVGAGFTVAGIAAGSWQPVKGGRLERSITKAMESQVDPSARSVPRGTSPEPNSGSGATEEQLALVRPVDPDTTQPFIKGREDAAVENGSRTTVSGIQPDNRPPYRSEEVPLDQIKNHPDILNWKRGANKKGVVQPLGGVYDRAGNPPIVLMEGKDGNLYMVTGRHRLDLAQRSGETTIPAHIFKEADGFTTQMAKLWDVESNIRDGQGEVSDYARFFRESGITEEQASARGLLARSKGRTGFSLGSYASDELFSAYANDKIGEERAAAIARGAPRDGPVQVEAMKARIQDVPTDQIENYARRLSEHRQAARSENPEQADLFGFETGFSEMVAKEARAASGMTGDLKEELNALRAAIRLKGPERAKYLQKYGTISLNDAQIQQRMEDLQGMIDRMQNWMGDRELHNKVRERAGLPPMEFTIAPTVKPTEPAPKQEELFQQTPEAPLSGSAAPAEVQPAVPAAFPQGTLFPEVDHPGELFPELVKPTGSLTPATTTTGGRSNPDLIYDGDTPFEKDKVVNEAVKGMANPFTIKKDVGKKGKTPSMRTAFVRFIDKKRGAFRSLAFDFGSNMELMFGDGKLGRAWRIIAGLPKEAQTRVAPMAREFAKSVMEDMLGKIHKSDPARMANYAMKEFTKGDVTLNRHEVMAAKIISQAGGDHYASLLRGVSLPRAADTKPIRLSEEQWSEFFNDKNIIGENEQAMIDEAIRQLANVGQQRKKVTDRVHGGDMKLESVYWPKEHYQPGEDTGITIENLQEGHRRMAIMPDESHSIEREGVVGPLILRGFFEVYPEVMHDSSLVINMLEPLQQAGRLAGDRVFSASVEAKWGRRMNQFIKDNLFYMAGRGETPRAWTNTVDAIRAFTITKDLSGNLKTAIKQAFLAARSFAYMRPGAKGAWTRALISTIAHPRATREWADAFSRIYNQSRRVGGTVELSTMLSDATSFNKSRTLRNIFNVRGKMKQVAFGLTKAMSNWSFKVDAMAARNATEAEFDAVRNGGYFTDDFKAATGLNEDAVRANPNKWFGKGGLINRYEQAGRFGDHIMGETHATSLSSLRAGIMQSSEGRFFMLYKAEPMKAGEAWMRSIVQAGRAVRDHRANPTDQNRFRAQTAVMKAVKTSAFYGVAEPLAFYLLDRKTAEWMKRKKLPSFVGSVATTMASYVMGLGDSVKQVANMLEYGASAISGSQAAVEAQSVAVDTVYQFIKARTAKGSIFKGQAQVRKEANQQFWDDMGVLGLTALEIPYQFPRQLYQAWQRYRKE